MIISITIKIKGLKLNKYVKPIIEEINIENEEGFKIEITMKRFIMHKCKDLPTLNNVCVKAMRWNGC